MAMFPSGQANVNPYYPFREPSFVKAATAVYSIDWTGTIILEFYVGKWISEFCDEKSIDKIKQLRQERENQCICTDFRFERFDITESNVNHPYRKLMSQFIEPPLLDYPTYICFRDGIETGRLSIKEKPASLDELANMVNDWITDDLDL